MSAPATRLPARGRRLSPDERKAELLDTAMAIVSEAGDLEAATLERVAARAGCSRNLVYRYFSHHDGLVEAMAERLRADFEHAVTASAADLPTRDGLTALVDLLLDRARSHGPLILLLFERPGGRLDRSQRQMLVSLLAARLRADGMPAPRSRVVAPILAAALVGAVGAAINGAPRSAVLAEVERLLDTFVP